MQAEITAREASLLKALRTYSFGHFVIYKANGILTRLESNESLLINEEDGISLIITKR